MPEIKGKPERTRRPYWVSAGGYLIAALVCLFPKHAAQAEPLSFIEKIRVGLHEHTVRIVLMMDRKPSKPHLTEKITNNPSITLSEVMPGSEVHRALIVRTPSFRKYLTEINIFYDPGQRSTRLSVRFVQPVSPPSILILSKPHRLVMDFIINNSQNSSQTSTQSRSIQPKRRRIVIPGKQLPSAASTPKDLQTSHSSPSKKIPSVKQSQPRVETADLTPSDRTFRVVLDAGHGGKDCGTMSLSGICEKILVLDIVKRLNKILARDPRFEVVLTRHDDRFVSLPDRTRIANESHGDLFLSVHANADPDANVRGLETFLLNLHSTDARAQRIAQRENSALGVSQGDLSAILLTLKINHKKKRSWELAQEIDDNLAKTLKADFPVRNLGIRQAPFYVIMGTTMPAVLTEVNFLSNKTDARMMDSSQFREETARALYNGIVSYYKSVHPENRYPSVTARLAHQEMISREP